MDTLKRKSSTKGSRKKRMLNLESHELPDIEPTTEIAWKSPGKQKQHRKNQGGERRKGRGKQGVGAPPSTVQSTSVDAFHIPASKGLAPGDLQVDGALTFDDDRSHDGATFGHLDGDTPEAGGVGPLSDLSDDASDSDPDDYDFELETYAEAVNTNVAGFQPVCGRLFVVQGWDSSRNEATKAWFHLKFQVMASGDLSLACTCPRASYNDCIHIRYFDHYRVEDQALDDKDGDWPSAVIFSQRIVPGVGLHSLFSVQSNSVVELRGRAIVSHEGTGREEGVWKCSKDTGTSSCFHITQAKGLLPPDFGERIASAKSMGGEAAVITGTNVGTEPRGPGMTISYLPIHTPHWATLPTDPVLYKPLPEVRSPPPNTILSLDDESTCADDDRTKFDPQRRIDIKTCKLYTLISVYPVDVEVQACPRCPKEKRRYIGPDMRARGIFNYNNSVLVSHELLDEYTSEFTSSETPFGAFVLRVSRRYRRDGARFMGEDLFRSVWFSYVYLQRFSDDMTCGNCGPSPNTVIFDGITLGYGRKHVKGTLQPPTMLSEHSLERKELRYYRKQQLLPDALLRRRVRAALEGPDFTPLLEDLEERLDRFSLSSPAKGMSEVNVMPAIQTDTPATSDPLSTPSITRSFAHFAMISSSSDSSPLPSTPNTKSAVIPGTSARIGQPRFAPTSSQSTVLPVTDADNPFVSVPSSAPLPPQAASPSKRGLNEDEAKARKRLLVREHLSLVEWVRAELLKQGGPGCPELASLFNEYFGQLAYVGKSRQPKRVLAVWKNLFMQIAAEESVLQMVNYKSWEQLTLYLERPTLENRSRLVSIPAFYKALACKECDISALNSVMRWVEQKVRTVLSALIMQASPPLPLAEPSSLPNDMDWMKTGSYYSMPVIRHRPKYPRLDDTEKSDKSGPRGDRCGKYYSEYKEKRLTGGIMVCWCQHSVCYGFHTIPESEGRNDVFSAMITRWPSAPERVIYDFACALGPYCMLREPQFFGNTSFLIDHFHAAGHTKCSPAAFLWEYENIDPQLSSVNSSAAECGNGALRRIRKSVSYMSQQRAIIYTKVFLSVWNRTRALGKKPERKTKGKGRREKEKEKERAV